MIDRAFPDLIDMSRMPFYSAVTMPPYIQGKMNHTSSSMQMETAHNPGTGKLNYELVSAQPQFSSNWFRVRKDTGEISDFAYRI